MKLKRPANIKKKLWRKASRKEREFIVWHEWLHECYHRIVVAPISFTGPGIGKTSEIKSNVVWVKPRIVTRGE